VFISQLSAIRHQLLCLPMQGMSTTPGAVLFQFQAPGIISSILLRSVIALLALGTGKGCYNTYCLLSHNWY